MKKTLLLLGMGILAAAPSFGQEKLVKEVERMAKKDNANLVEARTLIAPALTNAETAESAYAWYVAGLIEEKDVEKGYIAQQMQQQVDMPKFYDAVYNMADNYMKAVEFDFRPNDRGKVRPKFDDEIKQALGSYYGFLVNGGAEYLNKNDYENAHRFFDKFLKVKKMPLFADSDVAKQDSLSMEIGFFNAYTATQIKGKEDEALEALNAIKEVPYRQSDVYQLIASTYMAKADTAAYLKTLEEGSNLFPGNAFFLGNIINYHLSKGQYTEAKDYLGKVLATPDLQNKEMYYNALADIFAQEGNREEAQKNYEEALKVNPNYADATMGIGRLYYNHALQVANDATASIGDAKKMKELDAQAQDLFKKALPYLKKATELEPDNNEYLMALRNVYYNLKMQKEFDEIDQKLNK
ncbi:MAG: tetratricopeptide repeat protein [Porphyromonas sp.]|nr:tetratricopeptide repeat protein [Bacteroidales bacterium]MDD7558792.1 tetratricopeptide repeat protein [Bacteroidales bacterium]MDY3101279.1 tetratricopeptide repeat protein [Porphyromonas sp.]